MVAAEEGDDDEGQEDVEGQGDHGGDEEGLAKSVRFATTHLVIYRNFGFRRIDRGMRTFAILEAVPILPL